MNDKDNVEFTPWEGDPALTPSCGECGTLVADVETHRKYHEQLNQHVLKAIRDAQRRRGVSSSDRSR
jgi:hypothetical protein